MHALTAGDDPADAGGVRLAGGGEVGKNADRRQHRRTRGSGRCPC